MSSRNSCRSIVNLLAFIKLCPRHCPSRFVTTMSSIESRLGKGLVWPASVVLTTECITASVGLRKRTPNFTSPSGANSFTTVSKIC